jgi:hypothetical protein
VADYDVSVISLTTPAATAPLAQCRPVVSVRNNGIHDLVASGYLRIYSAGLLVFETEVYSDTIAPGETRPASAVDYWTPTAVGKYTVQGYVSCPLDQVEPNNNLYPTTITVSDIEPPPPPTPVAPHASQHEEGGQDELSIEGLPGRAADGQLPINHASFHENGGSDRIDVTGLPGLLGAPQTAKVHAPTHKLSGSDPLDVLALPNATALELVARKGAKSGYTPLDADAVIPQAYIMRGTEDPPDPRQALLTTQIWGYPIPHAHAASHEAGGADPLSFAQCELDIVPPHIVFPPNGNTQIIRVDLSPAQLLVDSAFSAHMAGTIECDLSPSQLLLLSLRFHSQEFTENVAIATLSPSSGTSARFTCDISAGVRRSTYSYALGMLHAMLYATPTPGGAQHDVATSPNWIMIQDLTNWYWEVLLQIVNGGLGSLATVDASVGLATIKPS